MITDQLRRGIVQYLIYEIIIPQIQSRKARKEEEIWNVEETLEAAQSLGLLSEEDVHHLCWFLNEF